MKQTPFDRFLEAARHKLGPGVSQAAIGRYMTENRPSDKPEVTPQVISMWKRRHLPPEWYAEICRIFGVEYAWLAHAAGTMHAAPAQDHSMIPTGAYAASPSIPVFTWDQIKKGGGMLTEVISESHETLTAPIGQFDPGSFALKIEQGQFKSIPAGSFVVFSPGGEWTDQAIALVRKSGAMLLRRLRSDGDRRLLVEHDEAPWHTEPFDSRHDAIIALKAATIFLDRR